MAMHMHGPIYMQAGRQACWQGVSTPWLIWDEYLAATEPPWYVSEEDWFESIIGAMTIRD